LEGLLKSQEEMTHFNAKLSQLEQDIHKVDGKMHAELKDLKQFVDKNENIFLTDDNLDSVIKGEDISSE